MVRQVMADKNTVIVADVHGSLVVGSTSHIVYFGDLFDGRLGWRAEDKVQWRNTK